MNRAAFGDCSLLQRLLRRRRERSPPRSQPLHYGGTIYASECDCLACSVLQAFPGTCIWQGEEGDHTAVAMGHDGSKVPAGDPSRSTQPRLGDAVHVVSDAMQPRPDARAQGENTANEQAQVHHRLSVPMETPMDAISQLSAIAASSWSAASSAGLGPDREKSAPAQARYEQSCAAVVSSGEHAGAPRGEGAGVAGTHEERSICFHLLHGRAYTRHTFGSSIGEHYEDATAIRPEWEVTSRLSFRFGGKSYGYTDPVPCSGNAAECEIDVGVTLLANGGAKRKEGKTAQCGTAQAEADAVAAASMRVAIAAAAPGQQRMMLQRALDKGKLVASERATVAEREMCMHLPQDELINAMEGGSGGVVQLLGSVRISLMVENDAVHRNADAAGRKHQRGKDAPKKQRWRKKGMQEGSDVHGMQHKEEPRETDDDRGYKGSRAKASSARKRTDESDAAALAPSKASGQGASTPKEQEKENRRPRRHRRTPLQVRWYHGRPQQPWRRLAMM